MSDAKKRTATEEYDKYIAHSFNCHDCYFKGQRCADGTRLSDLWWKALEEELWGSHKYKTMLARFEK